MFVLGEKSKLRLTGVHPSLVSVVKEAINISKVDFTVLEGLRSMETQRRYVREGKSKTLNSRHLTGHAVDLAPWVDGGIPWKDYDSFISIAEAMRQAAINQNVEILWGAAWDLALNYRKSAKTALDEYVKLRKSQKKAPFLDYPHFQLTWRKYP